jgi:DNA repair photolyase
MLKNVFPVGLFLNLLRDIWSDLYIDALMEYIQTKTILSRVKEDSFFGLSYNMNLYRGCQHGCIYCDSRSACYQMDDLSKIYAKQNAIELLDKTLTSKRHRGTIGFGSMNDPYMPVERTEKLTRRALELIARHQFPAHIMTKSDLVLRDLDLLREISKTYCAVTLTITTTDDELARQIEPGAPSASRRFEVLGELRAAGIYSGVNFMPVLPFINDTHKNVMAMVDAAKRADAGYILAYFGVTLREGSREFYYDQLDRRFPGLKEKYIQQFGEQFGCSSPQANALYTLFYERCKLHQISTKMDFYQPPAQLQESLF